MSDFTETRPNLSGPSLHRLLFSPWTVTITVSALVLFLDPGQAGDFFGFAANAFLGTLPYIVLAVVMIAWLKASGAETVIARAFQGNPTRMIVAAALFGGLAPFCSCEVIPFIAGLLALGAPLGAVMAFWLSSPLIDPPTLLITAGALGWPFAIGKAVAAVGLGLAGGFITAALTRSGRLGDVLRPRPNSGCGCGSDPLTGKPVWQFWREPSRRSEFAVEFRGNAAFLIRWLVMAYVLEAALVTYVPADMIARVVGGEGVGPVIIAALVGMPAYLNSYVAPPLLAGLTAQGMTAGAAMSFMVAGAVSSIPAMAAVSSLVRPRVLALYLGLGVSGAVVAGLLFELVA